jgi:hypothetical protein
MTLGSPKRITSCRRPTPIRDSWNEKPRKAEIARLRERCALLDSLLVEALRHKYIDESECSPRWLAEARSAVTSTTGRMVDE